MLVPLFPKSQLLDGVSTEEYLSTKITRHTNDAYELFTHADTSNA